MLKKISIMGALTAVMVLALASAALAVSMEYVTVGDPGNEGELSGEGAGGWGPDRICGGVDYTYRIGKYEVTAGQYCEFLNAVAVTDTYSLYNTKMRSDRYGCKIERTGTPGSHTYSVAAQWTNKPVNNVSFGDACRYANWLHNGQPSGAQDHTTTEDGAYFLNGATTDAALLAVTRQPDWQWAVTSEDEWYKAAYYDSISGGYYDYPTGSNTAPSAEAPPGTDLVNGSANYDWQVAGRTDVGAYESKPSDSPYGTFDQAGNVWEWTEQILRTYYRGIRGGPFCYSGGDHHLHAACRLDAAPTVENSYVGFRVGTVIPEPLTMLGVCVGLGSLAGYLRRRLRP